MDKIEIIAVALMGAILLFGVANPPSVQTQQVEQTAEPQGELVSAGTFIVEQGGQRQISEQYTLLYSDTEGYMLISQATVVAAGQQTKLSQKYELDPRFAPIDYQLAAETSSGSSIISLKTMGEVLHVEKNAKNVNQVFDIVKTRSNAVLDSSLMSHYMMLLMALQEGVIDASFTTAIPQELVGHMATVDKPAKVSFSSGGESYEGSLYQLTIGATKVGLLASEDELAGIFIPGEDRVGYASDVFPQGIELGYEGQTLLDVPVGVAEKGISFKSDRINLSGTLTVPEDVPGQLPGVVFIHDSGPFDRNENTDDQRLDCFRQLAYSLAENGIVSLRYDKRGVGRSKGQYQKTSMGSLVSDTQSALSALRKLENVDPQRCFVIGHGTGAVLAGVVASNDVELAGTVLVGAPAHPLDEIILARAERVNRMAGIGEQELEAVLANERQYLEFAAGSSGDWSDYPYLEMKETLPWLDEAAYNDIISVPLPLMRDLFEHDPLATIRKVNCPVLVVHGRKDARVSVNEAKYLAAALAVVGNDDTRVELIPDLDHALRYHPEEASFSDQYLSQPIDQRASSMITKWVAERSG